MWVLSFPITLSGSNLATSEKSAIFLKTHKEIVMKESVQYRLE